MQRNTLTLLVSLISALALLLILVSHSLSINYSIHEQYSNLIAQQIENNANINQYILQSRYNLSTSYEPLAQLIRNQSLLQQELSKVPNHVSRNGRNQLQQQLKINQQLFREQEYSIERFKSKNAVLKKSLTLLPELAKELKQNGVVDSNLLLSDMLNNVLLYTLSADEDLVPKIRQELGKLRQVSSQPEIKLVISHTQNILENKPVVEQLTNQILKQPIDQRLHLLSDTYNQIHWKAKSRANLFLQLSYGWFLVISAGIAYWMIRRQLEAKQRMLQVLESIQDAFIAVDQNWRVTYVNSQTAALIQQTANGLIGQRLWDIFPASLGIDQHHLYEQVVSQHRLQTFVAHLSFTNRWYEVRVYPSDAGLSIFIQDITARILAEQKLRQSHEQLELRVEERTFDLQLSNKKLQIEVAQKIRAQAEILFLQQVTQQVSETQDLSEALRVALKLICQKTGWEFGGAWIPHRCECLQYTTAWYQDEAVLSAFEQSPIFKCDLESGLLGQICQNQEPQWFYNIANSSKSAALESYLSKMGLNTSFGFPVIDHQQTIAVLVFAMKQVEDPEQQVRLVSTVILQISSLIRRKKAEGALRSSLATNTALIAALPDWMFRINLDGTIVNSKVAKHSVLPFNSDNFLGKKLHQLMPAEAAQNLVAAITLAQSNQNLEVVEYQLSLEENSYEFEARVSPSEDNEVIAIVRDITERKKAEADIQAALKQARELNELKTRFVSMASHEFRTPLATILSSSELLEHYRHKWSDDKSLNHLHRIQSATMHMTELLNDVLILGSAEAGKLEFKPTEVNLVSFCHDLVEEIQLSTSTHIIHFESKQNNIPIHSDPKLLRQIFYNLLSNAIKYSPKNENIYLSIHATSADTTIKVRDEGIGIPKEDIGMVFSAFDRGSNVGNISGTGLGLPIVKKAVEIHGGTIALESELNQGLTVTVTLPLLSAVGSGNAEA